MFYVRTDSTMRVIDVMAPLGGTCIKFNSLCAALWSSLVSVRQMTSKFESSASRRSFLFDMFCMCCSGQWRIC